MYVYKLKATTQRVSVALRRTTSRALMEMERRAKAYPSVAVGAAQPPPRARGPRACGCDDSSTRREVVTAQE